MSKQKNRYELTEELREKYKPIIRKWLDDIQNITEEERIKSVIDFGDSGLNPSTLQDLMSEEFGYEQESFESNGWQWDFWMVVENQNAPEMIRRLCICGEGITFDLKLRIK